MHHSKKTKKLLLVHYMSRWSNYKTMSIHWKIFTKTELLESYVAQQITQPLF